LEDYIQSFKGAVIAVSHDRYFLDKTMYKLLVFQGNSQILSFYGTMSEYLENQKEQEKDKEKPLKKPVKEPSTQKKEQT
ncbi:ABC transporter ATP-binding protein, partial [Enterococcus faecalis]